MCLQQTPSLRAEHHRMFDRWPRAEGCFLVNSALEMAPHHREVGVIITEQLGEVGAFSEGVQKALKARERRLAGSTPGPVSAIPRRPARYSRSCPLQFTRASSRASCGQRSRFWNCRASK